MTTEERRLATRTVRANQKRFDACSKGGRSQKEYGTVFNRLGGIDGAVVRRLREGAKRFEDEQMKRRPL